MCRMWASMTMWLLCAIGVALARDTAKLVEMADAELTDNARRELVIKRKKKGHGILHAAGLSSTAKLSEDDCTDMKRDESCKNIQGGGCEWHSYGWSTQLKNYLLNFFTHNEMPHGTCVDAGREKQRQEEAKEHKDKYKDKYCAHRCESERMRRDFALMTDAERDLYIEAVNLAYEQGIWTKFVLVHQDLINDPYAHHTSGFLPWHRLFLYELENALRCLGDKFQCLTLPYWDWAEWQFFCDENQGGCNSYDEVPKNMANFLGKKHPDGAKGVKNILKYFGGPGKRKEGCPDKSGKWDDSCGCTYGSAGRAPNFNPANNKCKEPQSQKVGCVDGHFKNIKDWDGNCLSRGTDWNLNKRRRDSTINNKPLTTNSELMRVIQDHPTYSVSQARKEGELPGFRPMVQNVPHNNQHNYLGGHMRSMRSPLDPTFYAHHSKIDKTWALWQDCHGFEKLQGNQLKRIHYKENDEDAKIDKDMPYWIRNPQKVSELCSEKGLQTKDNKCTECMGKHFGHRLGTEWCQKKWHTLCPDFCVRHDRCTKECSESNEKRTLTPVEFKRKDGQPYEYVWNHDKQGITVRDHLVHPSKYPEGGYSYMVDDFDHMISGKVCEMIHEDKAQGPGQRGQDRFRGSRAETEMSVQVKGIAACAAKYTAQGMSELKAYRRCVRDDSKDQCAKKNKLAACDTSDGGESCTIQCTGDIQTETNEDCVFHLLFGDGNGAYRGSNRPELAKRETSSFCKDNYLTHEEFAKQKEGKGSKVESE